MLVIDGSVGEGGGQVLRTALSLSLCYRRPFRLENIRARRRRAGLLAQHLAAVNATAAISNADVQGAAPGSGCIEFRPGAVQPGEYYFNSTAGSTVLLLQTLLPPLLTAPGKSRLLLEGGTHNPLAPPFEFFASAYIPLLARMGARVNVRLLRHGFHPAGGGQIEAEIWPAGTLRPLIIDRVDAVREIKTRVLIANLPDAIGERELRVVGHAFGASVQCLHLERVNATGSGNVVLLTVNGAQVSEVFSAVGERGVPAESVAMRAVSQVKRYLDVNAPVGSYLADQLLLPLTLAGGGRFLTTDPSRHTTTNMAIINRFVHCHFELLCAGRHAWMIVVGR